MQTYQARVIGSCCSNRKDVDDIAVPTTCTIWPVVLGAVSVVAPGVVALRNWVAPGVLPDKPLLMPSKYTVQLAPLPAPAGA
jgi:hypothetical protein